MFVKHEIYLKAHICIAIEFIISMFKDQYSHQNSNRPVHEWVNESQATYYYLKRYIYISTRDIVILYPASVYHGTTRP